MYRPPNPRFNNPPMDNRGHLYGPGPRHWTPDPKDMSNLPSKDANQSGQPQNSKVPPPAPQSYGPEVHKWKSSMENDMSEKQSSSHRARLNLYDPYDPEEPTDDRKKRRLSPKSTAYPIQQTEALSTSYRPPANTLPTAVRLSPPTTPRSYKQSSETSRAEVKKEPGRGELVPPKSMISCDLCEVELSSGQELEEHLDSKTHWDTLEHIQTHNNYDDMTMAFLQDVMLYKSQKNNRAIEDSALQALHDHDHMTKVEMFHCAACSVVVATSASAVQNHITSQGHMTNTKEFKVRQRRLCLDKAKTMMKELTPQFMVFAKGGSPFEIPRNTNSTS